MACKTSCSAEKVGMLSNRIKVQVLTQSTDSQGGYTDAWADLYTLWASIKQLSQREAFYGQQMESPATHRFMVRYVSGITTKHRVLFGSRTFNITRVNNLEEKNVWLEIDAVEGVAT